LLGLGFCFLQDKFRFIKLNEADYYLSYAPVKINWLAVAGVNVGTLVVTLLFLVLPSFLVSKIQPVKAKQFK
jgi:lipoprotein-releasing system permease protein